MCRREREREKLLLKLNHTFITVQTHTHIIKVIFRHAHRHERKQIQISAFTHSLSPSHTHTHARTHYKHHLLRLILEEHLGHGETHFVDFLVLGVGAHVRASQSLPVRLGPPLILTHTLAGLYRGMFILCNTQAGTDTSVKDHTFPSCGCLTAF